MIKIYGNKQSNTCTKVMYVAQFNKQEYEFLDTQFDALKSEQHLAIHPAGKIPVIDDDGFILFESNAICKYLCDKVKSPLYPRDLKQRALIDQWIDFSTIHVGGALSKVAFNRVWAPMLGIAVDENSIADGLKFLDRFLPVVNSQLSKYQFLAGEEISLADFVLLAALEYADPSKIDLATYSAIVTWRKKMQDLDCYKKVKE